MNDISPYNTNPELTAMKDDIASRNYNLMIRSAIVTGLGAVAGAVVGSLFIAALPAEFAVFAVVGGAAAGLLGGSAISEMINMKERTKLKLDEEMVQSYMSGKNYWGEGYREEVAEHGYGGPQQPHHGGVPNHRQTQRQV